MAFWKQEPCYLSYSNGTLFWQEAGVETLGILTADTEKCYGGYLICIYIIIKFFFSVIIM